MDDHAAGEPVVLLHPDRLTAIRMNSAMIGAGVVARAFGIADDEADPPTATVVAGGESLRPMSPCHVDAVTDASGLTLRWVARRAASMAWSAAVEDETGVALFARLRRESMEMTPRLGMPLLVAGQVQKELFHNEALEIADLVISASVEDVPVVAPPPNPVIGRLYRVAAGASGVFAGRDGTLAGWCAGGWRFVAPTEGMRLTERGSGVELAYRGGGWTSGLVRANELLVGGEKVVGIRQPAIANAVDGSVVDSQLRAVVGELLAAMREHGLIAR